MTKYQQALVRPSLQSLICIPVRNANNSATVKSSSTNSLLAVLSFDSDENLLSDFSKPEIQQVAADLSKILAKTLNP